MVRTCQLENSVKLQIIKILNLKAKINSCRSIWYSEERQKQYLEQIPGFPVLHKVVIIIYIFWWSIYWKLDISQTASYEITLICLSACLSVWPSVPLTVTKFYQNWIFSFFLILYMMIAGHILAISSDWWSQIFKKIFWRLEFGPKMRFFARFFSLDRKSSLKLHTIIACDNI